jgi:hypothetical protein
MNIDLLRIAIEPMTKVNVAAQEGYFSDPYPIHFAPRMQDSAPLTFSGTTQKLLSCSGAIRPECFQKTKIEVNYDALKQQVHAANTKIASIAAIHPYQNQRSEWDMVLALKVESQAADTDANAKQDKSWTVIAYATPIDRCLSHSLQLTQMSSDCFSVFDTAGCITGLPRTLPSAATKTE